MLKGSVRRLDMNLFCDHAGLSVIDPDQMTDVAETLAGSGIRVTREQIFNESSPGGTRHTMNKMENASRPGEFCGGIIHVDDLAFGGGYRHYLN